MRASSLNGNGSGLFLGSIVRSCNSLALGSVWSPLKARNPTKTAGLLSCKSMTTNSPVVRVKEKIDLIEKEKMIFDRLLATVCHFDLSTQLRLAGGWVRDKDFGTAVEDAYRRDLTIDRRKDKFTLDEELKRVAASDDVKDALGAKISRERIGIEACVYNIPLLAA